MNVFLFSYQKQFLVLDLKEQVFQNNLKQIIAEYNTVKVLSLTLLPYD